MQTINALVSTGVTLLIVAAVAWLFGGIFLRLGGLAWMIVSLLAAYVSASTGTATGWTYLVCFIGLIIGGAMWFTGHLIHAKKYGWWRSSMARHIWQRNR